MQRLREVFLIAVLSNVTIAWTLEEVKHERILTEVGPALKSLIPIDK